MAHIGLDGEYPKVEKENRAFCEGYCRGLDDVLGKYKLPLLSIKAQRLCYKGTYSQI